MPFCLQCTVTLAPVAAASWDCGVPICVVILATTASTPFHKNSNLYSVKKKPTDYPLTDTSSSNTANGYARRVGSLLVDILEQKQEQRIHDI